MRLLLLLLFLCITNVMYAQEIKKVEWGTSYDAVLAKFNFHKNRDNLFYVQNINGVDLYVTYYFNNNKLSKIILDLYQTVGTNKYESFVSTITNSLTTKYGTPNEVKRVGESSIYVYKSEDALIHYHKGKEGWSRVHYLEYTPNDTLKKSSEIGLNQFL